VKFSYRKFIYLLLFILAVIFLNQVIFFKRSFFIRDTLWQFHPWRVFAKNQVLSGHMPLWNPYSFCGKPFMANIQSAVFYPLTLIFYIFSFAAAYKLHLVIHLMLLSVSMFLLLKEMGITDKAAFAGSVVFSYSSIVVTSFEFLGNLATLSYFPLAFLIMIKICNGISAGRKITLRLFIFLTLIFTLQFFAGQPQILIIEGVFLFLYAVFVLFEQKNIIPLTVLLLSGISAALLAGAQILPSIEFFSKTAKFSSGIEDITSHSLNPVNLLRFIFPLRGLESNTPVEFRVFEYEYWVENFYIGVIPFFAAFLTIIIKEKKKVLVAFFWFAAAFSVFLALGRYNPVFKAAVNIMYPLRLVRYPARYMLICVFSLSILFAFSMDYIVRKFNKKVFYLLLFFSLADLFMFGMKLNPTINSDIYGFSGPKTSFLIKNSENELCRFWLTPKTAENRKTNNFFRHKDNLFWDINMQYNLFNISGSGYRINEYQNLMNKIMQQPAPEAAAKILGMMNMKYLISSENINSESYKLVFDGARKIYENKKFLSRAYIVRKAEVLPEEKVLDYIFSKDFNPGEEIVISKSCKFREQQVKNADIKPRARIIKYSSNEVEIIASSPGNSFLFISDSYYPGWKAYIDGKETEIIRANYVFRAVPVPEGAHRLEFIYKPLSFKAGLLISCAGMLIVICLLVFVKQ